MLGVQFKKCPSVLLIGILLTVTVTSNCYSGSSEMSARHQKNRPVLDESVTEAETPQSQSYLLSSEEIAELKKYAENYQPKSGREGIPSPPVLPEKISQIIAKAAAANSREHEKFVMLIFVRIARFHRENFKQTYELGRTNALTIEFYRLIGRDDFAGRERNSSALVEAYIEKNPELQHYALIEAEMQRIAKMSARIAND